MIEPHAPTLPKPRRSFSKRLVIVTFAFAWITLWVSMFLGAAMASLVVPAMVLLVASALGIYQGVGHLDLRAIAQGVARGTIETAPPNEGEAS